MIRYLENNEKQNIRPLYEHCFDDTKEYTDYYFQNRLPGNHVIVNERDNKIVNCVHLIPKTVILGKLKTNIIYIYGVGTYEEYRKQGKTDKKIQSIQVYGYGSFHISDTFRWRKGKGL